MVNQHRDSTASYIGHENLLDYFALVENESKARVKFTLLEVRREFGKKFADFHLSAPGCFHKKNFLLCVFQRMLQPCGNPPEKKEE